MVFVDSSCRQQKAEQSLRQPAYSGVQKLARTLQAREHSKSGK